ncbi:MAG: MFS transporter [Caldilineaceae bacterium]
MTSSTAWRGRFFTFWGAQAISIIGSSLTQFALVWWLTETTKSATILATSSLVALLPGILVGPIAGVLVDRWNRKRVINIADGVGALSAFALALLFWFDLIQIWHVYVIMFIRSIAGNFQFPAVQSSTSLMVPDDQLARVQGLNQMLQGISMIAAPPLGAWLISLLPFEGIMAIDVITGTFAIVLVLILHIPQPQVDRSTSTSLASVWSDFRQGIQYIVSWNGLLSLMVISSLLNLMLTPAFSLLPILVTRNLNGGAEELAWLNMAFGIGIVVGGALLSVWGGFKRRINTSMVGLLGMSIGVLMVGFAPANGFWWTLIGIALIGLMNPIANGPFFAILQSVVAPEIQGRIFTVIGSASLLMSPIGLAIAGPVSDRFGVQIWYCVGGIVALLMLVFILVTPVIRNLEDQVTSRETAPQ